MLAECEDDVDFIWDLETQGCKRILSMLILFAGLIFKQLRIKSLASADTLKITKKYFIKGSFPT
jgi:hypothetical protein